MARIGDWVIVHALTCVVLRTFFFQTVDYGPADRSRAIATGLTLLTACCWPFWSRELGALRSEAWRWLIGALVVAGGIVALTFLGNLEYYWDAELSYHDVERATPYGAMAILVVALPIQWLARSRTREMNSASPDLKVALAVQSLGLLLTLVGGVLHEVLRFPVLVSAIVVELIVIYPALMYLRAARGFIQRRIASRT